MRRATSFATTVALVLPLFVMGCVDAIADEDDYADEESEVTATAEEALFSAPEAWLWGAFYGAHKTLMADVNGDGKADGVALNGWDAWISLSTGASLTAPVSWSNGAFSGTKDTIMADVDGDGKADGVAVNDSNIRVSLSTGSGFNASAQWLSGAFYGTKGTFMADVNGDGKADGVAVNDSNIRVALSTGAGFGPPSQWLPGAFNGMQATLMADVNGDGKADGVAMTGWDIWVTLSNGTGFNPPVQWLPGAFYGMKTTLMADVNGDGKADGVAVNNGDIWVTLSTGSGFSPPAQWLPGAFYGEKTTLMADVTGDGRADGVAVNNSSTWVAPVPSTLITNDIVYNSGPILQPEIVPFYWGDFTAAERDSIQTYLGGLVDYISGGLSVQDAQPTIMQYGVRGATLGQPVVDPNVEGNGQITQASIASKIALKQTYSALPGYGPHRLFVVFLKGMTVTDTAGCTTHAKANGTNGQWIASVQTNQTSRGCGPSTDSIQYHTSRAIFEAATNPGLTDGWRSSTGTEVGGSICANRSATVAGVGKVAKILDAQQGLGCTVWTPQQQSQLSVVSQWVGGTVAITDVFARWSDNGIRHKRYRSDTQSWSSWVNLGGQFTSAPVAVAGARGAGSVDVFAQEKGSNNFVYKTFDGSSYSSTWQNVFPGNRFNGQPAVVSVASGYIDVFGMGTDGAYYHKTWKNSTGWAPLASLGGVFNGPPSAIKQALGYISPAVAVAGRGTNGAYYHTSYMPLYSNLYPTWYSTSSGTGFISEPVLAHGLTGGDAISYTNFSILGQRSDWSYRHVRNRSGQGNSYPNGWMPPETLSGTFMGNPAIVWQGMNQFEVVGQGTNRAYYHHHQDEEDIWAPLVSVNGAGHGAATFEQLGGVQTLFVKGTDRNIYYKSLSGTTWGNWVAIAANLH